MALQEALFPKAHILVLVSRGRRNEAIPIVPLNIMSYMLIATSNLVYGVHACCFLVLTAM